MSSPNKLLSSLLVLSIGLSLVLVWVFSPASAEGMQQSAQEGQQLFVRYCQSCHTIGAGNLIGPDLQGVTTRRDRAWLERFIVDHLAKIPGVANIRSSFALKQVRYKTALPLHDGLRRG